MNTATISPALEVATPKPTQGQANKPSDTGNSNSPQFSEVLSHQHASQSANSGKPSSDASASKQKESPDAGSHDAREQQDSELLKQASEAGTASATMAHITTDKAASLRSLDGTAQHRRLLLATEINATHPKSRQAAEGSATDTLNTLRFVASATSDNVPTDQSVLTALTGKSEAGHSALEKAPLETVNLHQSATADGKARQQASGKIAAMMAAAGNTDGRPSVQGNGKITVSEFSAAMVDAAAHAQSRFTHNATPEPATPLAMTGEHALAQGTLASSGSTIVQNGNLAAIPGTATPLSSPQWASDFGRQFVNIAQNSSNGIQIAELRLDPPELGPLRITINLSDSVAHASFVSPHAMVRQTVENALPQLQQLLAQAGISLGDTSVNDQSQAGQSSDGDNSNRQAGGNRAGVSGGLSAEGVTDASNIARKLSPDALVDTFA